MDSMICKAINERWLLRIGYQPVVKAPLHSIGAASRLAALRPADRHGSLPIRLAPRSQMPQFAPSSRFASQAPRQSRCNAGFHHGLLYRGHAHC